MKKVYGLIRRLGANSKYKGYFFVAEAVKISMGYQYKPLRITKDIYPWPGAEVQINTYQY